MAASFDAEILHIYTLFRIKNQAILPLADLLSAVRKYAAKFRFSAVALYYTTLSGRNQLYFCFFQANPEKL